MKDQKQNPQMGTPDPQQQADQQFQRALKKRGDTALHCAVVDNDPAQLKKLISIGLRVFNQSDADGATSLHWAAEVGSIECAQILLSHNADIDALNFMGQTPFHVASEREDIDFGKFLLKNRARRNCRTSCKKCRIFVKIIERHDRNEREREKNERQMKLEEQKMHVIDQRDLRLVEQMEQLDFLEELQRDKEEFGGPFFNKKENQILKKQQDKYRKEIEVREKQKKNQFERKRQQSTESCNSNENIQEVEKIRPARGVISQKQKQIQAIQPQDSYQMRESNNGNQQISQGRNHALRQQQLQLRNQNGNQFEGIMTQQDLLYISPTSEIEKPAKEKKRRHKKKKRDVEEIKTTKSKEENCIDDIDSEGERLY